MAKLTGSLQVDGNISADSFTGSVQGTATSASYISIDNIDGDIQATNADLADTASYVSASNVDGEVYKAERARRIEVGSYVSYSSLTDIPFITGDYGDNVKRISADGSLQWHAGTNHLTVPGVNATTLTGSLDFSNIDNKPTLFSGSSQVDFSNIDNKPTLFSGSSQVDFSNIDNKPTLFSGSSQVDFDSVTNVPGGLLSSSDQVDIKSELNTEGVISSSTQISDLGFQTNINGTFEGINNTGSVSFGYCCQSGDVWNNGGNLPQGRRHMGGAGDKSSALAFGGYAADFCTQDDTYEYNGSSWSSGGNLPCNIGYLGASDGTQNAAIAVGGLFGQAPVYSYQNKGYTYNGSTWSTIGANHPTTGALSGNGTTNAFITYGGSNHPSGIANQRATNHWNGSAWSAGGNLPHNVTGHRGTGTENAAIETGGGCGISPIACCVVATNEYNGSTWSALTDAPVNKQRSIMGGTTNTAFNAGGESNNSIYWNGTTWSTCTNITGNGSGPGGGGGNGESVVTGGSPSRTQTYEHSLTYEVTPSFEIDSSDGSIEVSSSISIQEALTLGSSDPLPPGSIGMLAVSASNLYFHNGSSWSSIS